MKKIDIDTAIQRSIRRIEWLQRIVMAVMVAALIGAAVIGVHFLMRVW